jgi:hypothetical protein
MKPGKPPLVRAPSQNELLQKTLKKGRAAAIQSLKSELLALLNPKKHGH